jgi:hypothetical protein
MPPARALPVGTGGHGGQDLGPARPHRRSTPRTQRQAPGRATGCRGAHGCRHRWGHRDKPQCWAMSVWPRDHRDQRVINPSRPGPDGAAALLAGPDDGDWAAGVMNAVGANRAEPSGAPASPPYPRLPTTTRSAAADASKQSDPSTPHDDIGPPAGRSCHFSLHMLARSLPHADVRPAARPVRRRGDGDSAPDGVAAGQAASRELRGPAPLAGTRLAVEVPDPQPGRGAAEARRPVPGMPWPAALSGRKCGPHLRPPGSPADTRDQRSAGFSQVRTAEDARFELARACTQHAFQACALGH